MELMYRPPGRKEHENLPVVLDEIFKRLEKIEKQLSDLNKN